MKNKQLKKQMAKDTNRKPTREERLHMTLKGKIDKQVERTKLFQQLQDNSMTNDQRQLLKATSNIGKKETNKESIERQQHTAKMDLKEGTVLPSYKYQKDTPLDRKKMTSDNIPSTWDEIDDDDDDFATLIAASKSSFQMPKEILGQISKSKSDAMKEMREDANQVDEEKGDMPRKQRGPKVAKKEAVVKRQEQSKKKYFFWKKDDMDMDLEDHEDHHELGMISKRQKELEKQQLKQQQQQQKGKANGEEPSKQEQEQEDKVDMFRVLDKNDGKNELEKMDDYNDEDHSSSEDESSTIELKGNIPPKVQNIPSTSTTPTSTTPTQNNKRKKDEESESNTQSISSKKKKELNGKQQQLQPNNNSNKKNTKPNNKNEKVTQIQEIEEEVMEVEDDKVIELTPEQVLEQEKKDELDRYNITIDQFGKEEEDNKVIMLSEKLGLEILEEQIAKGMKQQYQPYKFSIFNVPVKRLPEVDISRAQLPIMMEEHNIIEKIKENDVVIICGETGSGKTTQVPQFLYESGFGHAQSEFPGIIGVTQPRRVAAVSTAKRVAHELNCEFGKEVGYQIRYDRQLDTSVNKIKFMTDGILLREVQTDFLLTKYSCIIIDEAHERNLNTDILIGLLSRIVPMRHRLFLQQQQQQLNQNNNNNNNDNNIDIKNENGESIRITPLKLIVMSATLRVEDFKQDNLFSSVPPVISIPARQYPVTIHFNKKTVLDDYINEAYKKVTKIHQRLPDGGILVFVTGRQEVEHLCTKLRRAFPLKQMNRSFKEGLDKLNKEFEGLEKEEDEDGDGKDKNASSTSFYGDADSIEQQNEEEEDKLKNNNNSGDENNTKGDDSESKEEHELELEDLEVVNDSDIEMDDDNKEEEEDANGDDEDEISEIIRQKEKPSMPLYVLPLYANLQTVKQMRVFQTPPKGSRLVVVATNIAETSLTIPNIKYVVDTGRVKGRFYNKESAVSSFDITWTSKASADQRAGRAGRTGPGHCYRIYSSAVYGNHFDQFSKPEILLIPIEGMVLQMKSMGIGNVQKFPFPTPPEEVSLRTAMRTLVYLGALEKHTYAITDLGTMMSTFPVSPRYSKMILLGRQRQCLSYILAVVAILTVKNPFLMDSDLEEKDAPKEDQQDSKDDSTKTKEELDTRPHIYEEMQKKEDEMLDELTLQLKSEKEKERLQEEKDKEERKKKSQTIRNSYLKWMHKDSDILSILKVVGAFDFQMKKDKRLAEQFCAQQFLNFKSMSEIYKLRLQLSDLVNSILQDDDTYTPIDTTKPMKPPTANQELFIRQVIAAGLIDQVARIAQTSTQYQLSEYVPVTSLSQVVHIHPTSNLNKQDPQYVVYCDIIETKRPYMKLVTEVNPSWLALLGKPLCAEFKPLDDPQPKYSSKRDKVICYIKPSFGPGSWEMPMISIDHPNLKDSVKFFARALMDGVVCTPLLYLLPFLNTRSNLITLPNTNSKVYNLVTKLKNNNVNSKSKLETVWKFNPTYLLDEYLAWIDESIRPMVKTMWPPIENVTIPKLLRDSVKDISKPMGYDEFDSENTNYYTSFNQF